jgi:sialic acid synthase SpsE
MVEIIAELGWNFIGEMNLAEKMVKSAKESGADVVKFQYWNPNKLKPGVWDTDGRKQIYEKAFLTTEKIEHLQTVCHSMDIKFLISIFNAGDAETMKSIGIDSVKVPSHEVANHALHEFVATNFKECYVSLGAGSWKELLSAAAIYNKSSIDWCAMHCVSSYPCSVDSINLRKVQKLSDLNTKLGFSDHTQCVVTPSLSVMMGVEVIEKHFTTDNELPGRDNKFALNPVKFKQMVANIRIAEEALISHGIEASPLERDTIENYRGRWGD